MQHSGVCTVTLLLAQHSWHIWTMWGGRMCVSALPCSELRCWSPVSESLMLFTVLTGRTGRGLHREVGEENICDRLSCNDPLGLAGCLFLFLLCCRRALLWKRRGSITMRPHAPQRPRATASINLLSISCVLSAVPIEDDYDYSPRPPPPLFDQPWSIVCTVIVFASEGEMHQWCKINSALCLVSGRLLLINRHQEAS